MSIAEGRNQPVDDAAIDRLVDGCLDDVERRELLLRLESEPDGWRRCALAFLEDQAWRRAIAGPVPNRMPLDPSPSKNRPRRRRIGRLSIAASLLAATFAAGLAAGKAVRVRPPVDLPHLGPIVQTPTVDPPRPSPIREVGSINLVDDSAGETPPERVPILSGPGLDDQWLRDRPSTVPEYVRAQWERQGYQVEERRRLVSVVLEDGRRVSIPVDEVALQYVGQQPF